MEASEGEEQFVPRMGMPSSNIRNSGVIDLEQGHAHTLMAPKEHILGNLTARQ